MNDKIIAYTHGRYQPFHNGHLNTIKTMLRHYKNVWIGIANPLRDKPKLLDKTNTELVKSLSKSRKKENNPFSYAERSIMIYDTLKYLQVDIRRIRILPHFGFYDRADWLEYIPLPKTTRIIMVLKEYHHYQKKEKYFNSGYDVKFYKPLEGISGNSFRKKFPNGGWRSIVPKGTIELIEKNINTIQL